ncbi:MAG: ATP-binding cassette domain-containing protein [Candidatus Shapirobacteria bacterium]
MEVAFENVTKQFGLVSAIKDLSFKVNQGEFVFVIGPSGAGKSTIIRLIMRQSKPTHGAILIDGLDINGSNSGKIELMRRRIGVIFQDYQLIADKTVEENIALALDIIGYPHSQMSSQIDSVLKKVDLVNRRFLFPSQLSGGEMQRTALARALAINPQLILADEPTGNLDSKNSWKLVKLLQQINHDSNVTIIMTTHNSDIYESLPYRQITLKSGKIG